MQVRDQLPGLRADRVLMIDGATADYPGYEALLEELCRGPGEAGRAGPG
jgi:hypothetical protein